MRKSVAIIVAVTLIAAAITVWARSAPLATSPAAIQQARPGVPTPRIVPQDDTSDANFRSVVGDQSAGP